MLQPLVGKLNSLPLLAKVIGGDWAACYNSLGESNYLPQLARGGNDWALAELPAPRLPDIIVMVDRRGRGAKGIGERGRPPPP